MALQKSKDKKDVIKTFIKYCKEHISDYEKQTGRRLNVEIGDQHAGNCKYDPNTKLVRSIDYGASKRVYRSK